jgi:DNA invertase Pin-like site-specific DNA recombinase
MSQSRRRLACAIYTRKSSDEGLDQAFNSLEAQREACLAYVASQAGEGWTALPTLYDDGGFSGGNMQRPALQRLLADIGDGRIDVVVVYKVDRLTRSLTDFARIVEAFDAKEVSFVSVTQAFNTTSSMGRLTLNVLLSFAQFEREVTGERIRDKIAASKKKGMWMGGVVPLGYDAENRSLVVNPGEAETVRTLFELYLRFRNIRLVKEQADRLGLRTKARPSESNPKRKGGGSFQRGHINKVLTNPVYAGEILHKGTCHPAAHEPIIDRGTWDAVQAQLKHNAIIRRNGGSARQPSLLAGLLFDAGGVRLSPSHANKKGRRYRYYTSRGARPRWRLPAEPIEKAVLEGVQKLLSDRHRLSRALQGQGFQAGAFVEHLKAAEALARALRTAPASEQREMLLALIARIIIADDRISVVLRADVFRSRIGIREGEDQAGQGDGLVLDLPVSFRRRGVETRLIIGEAGSAMTAPDPKLVKLLGQAQQWHAELRLERELSLNALAERHGVDSGDISRILPFAFLAPDLIEAIIDGRQPPELSAARLNRLNKLPLSWARQRDLLGFA